MPGGRHTCPWSPPERKAQGGASPGKSRRRGSRDPGIMRGGARRRVLSGRKGQVLTCRVLAHGARARVALACSKHTSPGPAPAMPPDPGVGTTNPCFRPLPEVLRREKGSSEERDAIQLRSGAAHPGVRRRDRGRRGWISPGLNDPRHFHITIVNRN